MFKDSVQLFLDNNAVSNNLVLFHRLGLSIFFHDQSMETDISQKIREKIYWKTTSEHVSFYENLCY